MQTGTLTELFDVMQKKKLFCEVKAKSEAGNFTFAEVTLKFKEEDDLKKFINIVSK